MICLLVLAVAVFTASTPASSCTVRRFDRKDWNTPPPGFVWEDAFFGGVPHGAVVGGHAPDGEKLFICRTFHHHNLIPGKVSHAMGNCDVAWGGKEHDVPVYQVLVNKLHIAHISWVDAKDGDHPHNAVVGGYKCDCDSPKGDLQYIGRTNYPLKEAGITFAKNVVFPGKVTKCTKDFHWSYGGKAYAHKTYQIAVWNYVPTTTPPPTTEVPTTTEEIPTTTEFEVPTTTEFEVPTTTEFEVPTTTEEIPTSTEVEVTTEVPTTTEEVPTTTEEVPTTTEEVPTTTEEVPAVCTSDPASRKIAAPAGLAWEKYSGGGYPSNAVSGGRWGWYPCGLYICRAEHKGSVIVGKLGMPWKGCMIGADGHSIMVHDYDVLTRTGGSVDLSWVHDHNGDTPAGAVAAGYNCACHPPAVNYVGKSDSLLCPDGKCMSNNPRMYSYFPLDIDVCHHKAHYTYKGKQYHLTEYEALVAKERKAGPP